VIGGAVTGGAIGAMHYVGMSAVRAAADVSWDLNYVVASVAIGVVLTAFAMRAAIGKTSLRAHALGAVPTPEAVMAPGTLAIAVASVAVLIVAIGLMGAVLDHHLARRSSDEAARLRAYVAELEMTKHSLETTSQGLSVALEAAASASKA
jgi:NO-binding membrane sensor protein with MHYT domain